MMNKWQPPGWFALCMVTEVCAGLGWLQCRTEPPSSVTSYSVHWRMFPFKGLICLFSPKPIFYLKKKRPKSAKLHYMYAWPTVNSPCQTTAVHLLQMKYVCVFVKSSNLDLLHFGWVWARGKRTLFWAGIWLHNVLRIATAFWAMEVELH